MEYNLKTALIIISAVVITAIFVHGFWTIRKNKNPYKLKAKAEKVEPQDRGFDGSGFDQDGVSKPRVVENHLPMKYLTMRCLCLQLKIIKNRQTSIKH